MNKNHLELFAHFTGIGGIFLAALTGFLRITGLREFIGFESITLLVGAIALMAASCVVQLYLIRKG